jgi:diguanylate cyclase (GGDEF)-like protein
MALLCLVGVHMLAGFAPAFRCLYILPIWAAIRLGGRKAGFLMVLVANAPILMLDLRSGDVSYNSAISDGFLRMVAFGGLAWLISNLEERLAHSEDMAFHDPLTGLYNRRALNEFWSERLKVRGNRQGSQTVAMIDCDGFKHLNDCYGHAAGDQVLKILAEVLESETRSTDLVARVGGDEFVILLSDADKATARRVLQRIEHIFESMVRGAGYSCSISVGYVPVNPGDTSMDAILRLADRAMYERKELKKGAAFLN